VNLNKFIKNMQLRFLVFEEVFFRQKLWK